MMDRSTGRTRVVHWFACVVCMAHVSGEPAIAQPESVPFVAGFDRFARHGKIDTALSGWLLLTELSCTACHTATSEEFAPKLGPRLTGVGNRVRHDWIARFLRSPQLLKPGTTMPDVLAAVPESERAETAAAIAEFLMAQQEPFPEIKGTGARPVPHEFWNQGDVAAGRQLYHRVGCVACHEPDQDYETVESKPSPLDQLLEQLDADELKELGLTTAARRVESVPHGDLLAKYSRQSLTFFLLDPHSTRPSGRMPNLKLSVVEAADIATWLLREQPQRTVEPAESTARNSELVENGRRLFGELGCANCHAVTGTVRGAMSKPLAQLDAEASRSCMGAPQTGLPHFLLDSVQSAAIKSALAERARMVSIKPANVVQSVAEQQLHFQLLKLNCLACHERDMQGGVGRYRRPYFETIGHVDIGDEGRLPPPLTAVGRKLQTGWLTRVLQGNGDVRSHLRIRMPVFPAEHVKSLPALLVEADHSAAKQPAEKDVFGDISKLADDGRLLLDTGCVQCHPLRGDALPGVVGIDLQGIATRVHPQWFHDFLLDPGQLKSRTRMPTFFPGGQSQNRQILAGDTEQQIAAMWAYLKGLERYQLPPKIEQARSQDYELIPKDRPIVLRTFMDEAGTHAIAVGFPQRIHLAFDAEQVRFAHAWRGRFLDARGTWFERFAPPARPLGEKQINLPPGVPFAMFNNEQFPHPTFDAKDVTYQFLGYRLDKSGVPTFLYRFGRFDIEDHIQPTDDGQLSRRLTITDRTPEQSPASLWLRGHVGRTLKYESPMSYTSDVGLTVSVSQNGERAGELNGLEGRIEWLIPLTIERKKSIEVRYRW